MRNQLFAIFAILVVLGFYFAVVVQMTVPLGVR